MTPPELSLAACAGVSACFTRRLLTLAGCGALWATTVPAQVPSVSARRDVGPVVSPPMMDMRAWSVGTGLSAGLVGAELIRRLNLQTEMGVGVGVGGVGGRLAWLPFEAVGRAHTWIPYAGVEGLYSPWRVRELRARWGGAVGVGVQRWGAESEWFADVGVGVAYAASGTWFNRRALPLARLGVGRGRPF